MDDRKYKPHEFAKLVHVSVKTLQRWDAEGKLKAFRTPTDRRYYTHDQYLEWMGKTDEGHERINVIYARVSTRGQKDDLKNQKEFLETFCAASGLSIAQEFCDFGSGLNYKRKEWNRLLSLVMEYRIDRIVIASQDRFVRFGFDWFKGLCARFGTEILVVNNETHSPQEELVRDIVSILHVFSCRLYGLSKYKAKIRNEFRNKT